MADSWPPDFSKRVRFGRDAGERMTLGELGDQIVAAVRDDGSKGFRLVKLQELDDVLSRKAFTALHMQAEADSRYHLPQARFARFEHEGRYHHAMLTPFSIAHWPWIIGVHLPEDDYLGGLKGNRRDNILLTLAISAIATLLALVFARSIIRPIAKLEQEALALDPRVPGYLEELLAR